MVDAGSLRTEGEQAFLIYRGAEGTVYAMPDETRRREPGRSGRLRRPPLLGARGAPSRQTTWSRSGPTPTSRIGTPTKSAM